MKKVVLGSRVKLKKNFVEISEIVTIDRAQREVSNCDGCHNNFEGIDEDLTFVVGMIDRDDGDCNITTSSLPSHFWVYPEMLEEVK